MYPDIATEIYNTLTGIYVPGSGVPGVDNAFALNQPCSILCNEAYDAYHRLCERLSVTDEDEDIEIIFNALLSICKIVGLKMFHYGEHFGQTPD